MDCQDRNTQRGCNLCAGRNYKILEAGAKPYKLVKCDSCNLVYIVPLPADELLRGKYDSNYRLSLKKLTLRSTKIWQKRLKMVGAFCKKGRLLDVGCGDATFLLLAQKNGWEVYGVETSKANCDYIKERFGFEIYNGELKNADYPDEYFDVVTFWHSLEHMADPKGNLRVANRILKKDGLLAVATPNIDNYIYKVLYLIARLKKKPHFLFEDQEKEKEWHLYFFSPRTIGEMLKKTGFSIFCLFPDSSGVTLLKRIIDKIANSILFPLRMKLVLCMQVYARKEPRQLQGN